MFKSNMQFSKLALLAAVLAFCSTQSAAEIYKWRDARGVTKYSDVPPPFAFTKATRTEQVNALQAKEVCVLPNNAKTLSVKLQSAKLQSAKTSNINLEASSFINRSANNANLNIGLANNVKGSTTTGIFSNASSSSSRTFSSRTFNRGNSRGGFPGGSPFVVAQNTPAAMPTAPIRTNTTPTASAAPLAVLNPVKPAAAPPTQTVAQASQTTAPSTMATPSSALPANIVQVALMPAVDINKNISQATGYSSLRIQPTTELPTVNGDGAFRVTCTASHMSNDDPMVYPNQPGAAHHHTFFGNTSTNAKSDLAHMDIAGNSTCTGGNMNHSAYWIPSMIDTANNQPVKPDSAIFYYKSWDVPNALVTQPPKGLRMIAGNSKATSAATAEGRYSCVTPSTGNGTAWSSSIPNCAVGTFLLMQIMFPQCWDGVNLDSPNHKDHMAAANRALTTPNKCPATHPVAIPSIAVSFDFNVTTANQTKNWRLASDNYSNTSPGGYSTHADWVNGWDEKIMAGFVKNCLNKGVDCHAHLLGDGRMFF